MGFKDSLGLAIDEGLETGTYKYDGQGELKGHRFHLRVDSHGKGVLLIDASRLVFLNGTALDAFPKFTFGIFRASF